MMVKRLTTLLLPTFAALTLLATFPALAGKQPWEGPFDEFTPPPEYTLVYSNYAEGEAVTVTVPAGDVFLEGEDADPEWESCDPPERETWLAFHYSGIVDPVPLQDTTCPDRPEGGKTYVKLLSFTVPVTVTIQCGADSCHGRIWHRGYAEAATGTPTPAKTSTPKGTPTGTPTDTPPTATATLTPTATPTLTPTPAVHTVYFPYGANAPPTPTPTPTATNTPTVTPTPTRTEEPACTRIDFEEAPPGHDVVREAGTLRILYTGNVLATWRANAGDFDSGWMTFPIPHESVNVTVDWKGDDGRIIGMLPAPGHSWWLTRGTCHALEVMWP